MPGNSTPDVRIRLSAEGLSEVVAAFQKISSEGKKSAQQTSGAFGELSKQFSDVGRKMAGIFAVGLAVDKFHEFFKSTLEGVETLERLSRQTGLSTGALQAFQRAARETGISQESANKAIEKFTVQVGKAEIGSKQSGAALSDLGIRVRDLAALPADQKLTAVARALAQIHDPARRARDEVALFGKTGIELDQALVKVGQEGLAPFIQHLKDLGIYLDDASIKSLKGAQEGMRQLGDTVKGVATQLLIGLVPGLQSAADELLRATTGPGVSGFKKLGEYIADFTRFVVTLFVSAAKEVTAMVAAAQVALTGLAKAAWDGVRLRGHAAMEDLRSMASQIKAIDQAAAEDVDGMWDRLRRGPETPAAAASGGAAGQTGDTGNPDAKARALLALLNAQLDNERKLYSAHAALLAENDRAQYEARSISLQEYFTRRAAAINAQNDEEISILRRKRAAEAALRVDANDDVGQINRRRRLLQIDGEIADLEARRQSELARNTREQAKEQEKLYTDSIRAQEQLLNLEGKRTEAARLRLQLELEALRDNLQKSGAPAGEIDSAMATATAQGNAKINFDDQLRSANGEMSALHAKIVEINQAVQTGQLFAVQGAVQIRNAEVAMLPALEARADALQRIAQATGNADDIQKAAAYRTQVDQIRVATDQWGQEMAKVKQTAEDAFANNLTHALDSVVNRTMKAKEAFREFALSTVEAIEQVIIKLLIMKAIQAIAGGFSSGGQVDAGSAAGHAAGGLIRGPGSSTSDSIPAWLSDKEFVVNARAVAQPGVLPMLEAINGGTLRGVHGAPSIPKFAAGGLVNVSGAAGTSIRVINVLDPSLLGDHLATAAGEQAVINILSRNPTKVRGAIG
ncbi:MAG: hypothetical protein JSR67_03650 [Proteobacteria bacterium]|nr:hypothetical protein [Pseudomonadota bacterium]